MEELCDSETLIGRKGEAASEDTATNVFTKYLNFPIYYGLNNRIFEILYVV